MEIKISVMMVEGAQNRFWPMEVSANGSPATNIEVNRFGQFHSRPPRLTFATARNAVQGGAIERPVGWTNRYEHIAAGCSWPHFSYLRLCAPQRGFCSRFKGSCCRLETDSP